MGHRIGWLALLAVAAVVACGSGASPATPDPPTSGDPTPTRVLLFTATAGFRHDAIVAARTTMAALAVESGAFTVTASEDVADLAPARLAAVDVVMFALTSGELPLTAVHKAGLLEFVTGGGGFIGVHSATDTLYTWPEYGSLVGAYFKEHPWTRRATVVVEDRTHPTTSALGPSFELVEEYYTFQQNPRPAVHVLLSLDAASVGATGDHPLAWTSTFGQGRVYYNALGHFAETWNDARFRTQMREAVGWVARR